MQKNKVKRPRKNKNDKVGVNKKNKYKFISSENRKTRFNCSHSNTNNS